MYTYVNIWLFDIAYVNVNVFKYPYVQYISVAWAFDIKLSVCPWRIYLSIVRVLDNGLYIRHAAYIY